ncbi:ribbon-helix-helix domain-containing protein, partial [Bradyrhizobium sp.]|uniref:ribbon-helix-helix domain-containing protein n=1 Tax=Bradyrhizobium sp. TaxID=376 RepID=UPI003C6F5140
VIMCKIFIGADPALYDTSTRSIRLHGVVTSIRLETLFWNVLTEIGRRDDMSVGQLITRLYDEITEARGEVENLTSFLRVCCLRYLSLQISGGIPGDVSIPIRSLDADEILAREQASCIHGPGARNDGTTAPAHANFVTSERRAVPAAPQTI